MKMLKIGKDGKITKLTGKEMVSALLNSAGYAILALLILSFFIYVVAPFIGITITLFQALTYITILAVVKHYWFAVSGQSFLIRSTGYIVFLGILYYGMTYYAK